MQHVSHNPSSSRQQKISTLQRKPSNHSERNSSSKQTSTYHPNEGFYDSGDRDLDNVQSGWRPIQVRASPFGDHSEEFVDSDNAVQIFDTPPHSCSEDEQQPRIVRQKSGIHAADGPERTKSKLLSDIAEQVSRGQYMRPGHSRKSSGDSQDSCRDPLRRAKKRRWNLSKAFSAPEEDVYGALEAGNWAQQMYHQERAYQGQLHSHRPEYGALRGRAVGRKRYTGRYRTSKYIGVGSSNRKTQWQARILVQGKVTHLGYYPSEEEAARVYDRVALSLNPGAQTNFPASQYPKGGSAEFSGLGREDLQRALGVKPMDKSSRFRGVSRKKGKWEAKVMVNRKWAYRALFDSEDEAAHAYDAAVWRLKPKEASSFINFKDGVSVRDSPKQSSKSQPQNMGAPRLPETSPIKLEEPEDVLASEPVMLTELNIPEHDENEIMDEAPVFLCSEPIRSQSVQLPLRSQSEQLPMYGSSSLARTESCQVQLQALNQAPSLPNDLSLVNQGSLNVNLPPLAVSPQQSMCDQTCLPALPPLAVPVMDLPDPNSIGVPPPENLPYPELVTGPSTEILPGGGPLRSATSTPTHVTSNLLPGQLTHSPSRTSSGLPPLPALTGRSSHPSSEANARYVPGSQTSLNPATPRSQYTEYRPEVHLQANPFYDVASVPVSTVSAETCGLSHAVSIDNQASVRSAMELGSQINRATSEGILRSSSIARELPYSSSLPEVAPAVCLAPHLSHSTSLASLNTAHYYQPGPPTADIAGDLFPGSNVSPMESTISYDHVQSLANSRSASSSFLHSAQSANNGLLRTSSTNPGLPLYHVPEMRMVGHELPQATIHINNGLPIDPNFMGRPDLTPAQIVNLNSPNLPVARTLNAEQADLLANLDVDVEANDPISINPVQIGGEDMNVYSAHIMGNVLH